MEVIGLAVFVRSDQLTFRIAGQYASCLKINPNHLRALLLAHSGERLRGGEKQSHSRFEIGGEFRTQGNSVLFAILGICRSDSYGCGFSLEIEAARGDALVAVDKGDVERHIPIDNMLRVIIGDALAAREAFKSLSGNRRLFVNANGNPWDSTTLLRAAQRAWKRAGLERRKIHELRHTLGTLAGRQFPPGMVQAAMSHRSRKSAGAYFHPTEEMAAEVRQKIITDLSQNLRETRKTTKAQAVIHNNVSDYFECPHCGETLLISKD